MKRCIAVSAYRRAGVRYARVERGTKVGMCLNLAHAGDRSGKKVSLVWPQGVRVVLCPLNPKPQTPNSETPNPKLPNPERLTRNGER